MDHYQARDTNASAAETEGKWKVTGTVVSVSTLELRLECLLTSALNSAGMDDWNPQEHEGSFAGAPPEVVAGHLGTFPIIPGM